MLHVHNGDSSANLLKQSELGGEHLPWREALIAGPTPADVAAVEWKAIRARHLADFYGGDVSECRNELLAQEEQLARFNQHEEVTLWFEHDLFCQTNLLYLLNWFAGRDLGNTKLSLVCVGEFSGIESFRGLGQLTPTQMASLFDNRHEVSSSELALAQTAWEAYCSPDPRSIESLLQGDTTALPFLKDAFQSHLQRFPSVRNGLGRIESRTLELIDSGTNQFHPLFSAWGVAEPIYGLGDSQFWIALTRMSTARVPLVVPANSVALEGQLTPEHIHKATFEITAMGKKVLSGDADAIEVNGIDQWLGGVHVFSENIWRWDQASARLRPPA